MTPDPTARFGDLACLLPLTGIWRIESDVIAGETSFAWSPGRRFLVQVFDFRRDGRWLDGIEIIGKAGEAIASRAHFFRDGEVRDHVWRLDDGELTVWRGKRGSDTVLSARFDADGRRIAGAWRRPGGGFDFEAVKVAQP